MVSPHPRPGGSPWPMAPLRRWLFIGLVAHCLARHREEHVLKRRLVRVYHRNITPVLPYRVDDAVEPFAAPRADLQVIGVVLVQGGDAVEFLYLSHQRWCEIEDPHAENGRVLLR